MLNVFWCHKILAPVIRHIGIDFKIYFCTRYRRRRLNNNNCGVMFLDEIAEVFFIITWIPSHTCTTITTDNDENNYLNMFLKYINFNTRSALPQSVSVEPSEMNTVCWLQSILLLAVLSNSYCLNPLRVWAVCQVNGKKLYYRPISNVYFDSLGLRIIL